MDKRESNLKYLVIGTGGTGGAIGGFLAHAGFDVTFIARGSKLQAMRTAGLKVQLADSEFVIDPVAACTSDEYAKSVNTGKSQRPDVIFVCVKGYSLDSIIPMLSQISGPETLIIPILNVYGTGARLQQQLTSPTVLDGCIYIWASHREPGCIAIDGHIFRVVFGLRQDQKELIEDLGPKLEAIENDLSESGIEAVLSDNIERDALLKFSYVSPQSACGLYYNKTVDEVNEGESRESFINLVREISNLADAMDLGFEEDIVQSHLKTIETAAPGATTSMQRDISSGGPSEIHGLIYQVVEWAERYGVDVPEYRKIADEMHRRGLK